MPVTGAYPAKERGEGRERSHRQMRQHRPGSAPGLRDSLALAGGSLEKRMLPWSSPQRGRPGPSCLLARRLLPSLDKRGHFRQGQSLRTLSSPHRPLQCWCLSVCKQAWEAFCVEAEGGTALDSMRSQAWWVCLLS